MDPGQLFAVIRGGGGGGGSGCRGQGGREGRTFGRWERIRMGRFSGTSRETENITRNCTSRLQAREKSKRIEKLIAKPLCPLVRARRGGSGYSLRIKDETESRTKEEKYSLSRSKHV
jgi:hypothetical protein